MSEVIGGQHLDAESVGALEAGLALDVAQLRLGLGHEDAAGEEDFEIAAELGLQPGPDPDRLEHERNGRREVSRPALALAHEGFVRDLGVDAAGVAAGGLGIEVVALDQRDLDALAGQVVGRGAAGETAADDEDVGMGDFCHRILT